MESSEGAPARDMIGSRAFFVGKRALRDTFGGKRLVGYR